MMWYIFRFICRFV